MLRVQLGTERVGENNKGTEQAGENNKETCSAEHIGGGKNIIGNCQIPTNAGSPILRKTKRRLKLSPSTPVGLSRKLQNADNKLEVGPLTLEEDVEMVDLDLNGSPAETNTDMNDFQPASERKFKRGLRRKLVEPSTSVAEITGKNNGRVEVALKGKSVKLLRQRNKSQHHNYKSTKKKKNNDVKMDKNSKNQRLIDEFVSTKPRTNQVIIGLKADGDPKDTEQVADDSQ